MGNALWSLADKLVQKCRFVPFTFWLDQVGRAAVLQELKSDKLPFILTVLNIYLWAHHQEERRESPPRETERAVCG